LASSRNGFVAEREAMNLPDTYLVNPQQTLAAARQAGLGEEQLALSGIAVLTFSRVVVDRLDELCGLEDVQWISAPHHPYAAVRVVRRGSYQGLGVTALVPPMGASPLACIVEDLITCGVQAFFLVCAAWSLGPPVQFGDLILPTFSAGRDGTSIHYGNTSGHVFADAKVVEALATACGERGVVAHAGGNATCEALYRITSQVVGQARQRGCLTMDNGEASTLLAVSRILGVRGGVIFQPYIELERGWDPARLRETTYRNTCRFQAEVALEAAIRLADQGLIGRNR
jgi:uridine phosphorylase